MTAKQVYRPDMSLFRRHATRPGVLVAHGRELIERTARAHRERWGAGTAERCELDPSTGVLRWTFDDRVVEAPAQALGTCRESGSSRTWVWAWADDALPPQLRAHSDAVRRWGADHGHEWLTVGTVHGLTARRVGDLAALAFVLTRASGFYRAPLAEGQLYLTFGPVVIRDSSGTPRPVTVELDPSDRPSQRSWPETTLRRRGA